MPYVMVDTLLCHMLWLTLFGFCLLILGVAQIGKKKPQLNVCTTGCNEFASNQLIVSRSSTIILYMYLVYLKTIKPSRECHCAYIQCSLWVSSV